MVFGNGLDSNGKEIGISDGFLYVFLADTYISWQQKKPYKENLDDISITFVINAKIP